MAACNEAQQMLEATVNPDVVGLVPWVGMEDVLFCRLFGLNMTCFLGTTCRSDVFQRCWFRGQSLFYSKCSIHIDLRRV